MLVRQAFIFYARHLFPEALNLPVVHRFTQVTQNAEEGKQWGVSLQCPATHVKCTSTKEFPLNSKDCVNIFLTNTNTSMGRVVRSVGGSDEVCVSSALLCSCPSPWLLFS